MSKPTWKRLRDRRIRARLDLRVEAWARFVLRSPAAVLRQPKAPPGEYCGTPSPHRGFCGLCEESRAQRAAVVSTEPRAKSFQVSPVRLASIVCHQVAHAFEYQGPLHGEGWRQLYLALAVSAFDLHGEALYTAAEDAHTCEMLDLVVMGAILDRWEGHGGAFAPPQLRHAIIQHYRNIQTIADHLGEWAPGRPA